MLFLAAFHGLCLLAVLALALTAPMGDSQDL